MHIRPTPEQLQTLATSELEGPVVMLNLLKFAEKAGGEAPSGISGAEAYQQYGEEMQAVLERTGAKVVWRGRADSVVIGDDLADGWDAVALVEYPSRKAFLAMATNEGYQKLGQQRANALADSRLIAMTEQFRRKD